MCDCVYGCVGFAVLAVNVKAVEGRAMNNVYALK